MDVASLPSTMSNVTAKEDGYFWSSLSAKSSSFLYTKLNNKVIHVRISGQNLLLKSVDWHYSRNVVNFKHY